MDDHRSSESPSEAATTADAIRAVIDRLTRDGTAIARSTGAVHKIFPTAVGPAEGEIIRDWISREQAVQTIEIGFGYGISALFACEALVARADANARHVVIDPYQSTRFADCGVQFAEEARVAHLIEHHAEESQLVLPRLLSEGRQFDFAFIDGNHRFDAVYLDLYYLGRLVRPGGVIILDDYQLPGIAKAVAFYINNRGWTIEDVSAPDALHQWAVLRSSREPDSRPYHYFVDF